MDAVFFISLWRLLLIVIPQRQQNARFTAVAAVRESSEPAYRRSGRPRSTSLIPQRQQGPQEGLGMTLDVYCDCGIDVQCVYYFSIFVSQFFKRFLVWLL